MSKRATADLGTVVEYAFNFEKDPDGQDTSFWMSYLKRKEEEDALEEGAKAKVLEYHVELADISKPEELDAIEQEPAEETPGSEA